MSNSLLIIKNITHEGPGSIEKILQETAVSYLVVDLTKAVKLPEINDFQAIIVLGGPDSANDNSAKILAEISLIKEVLVKQKPYLGICLGMQLLVKAAGGVVMKNPIQEIGFIDPDGNNFCINLTKQGKQDPLLNEVDDSFNVFQLHSETVGITENSALLGTGQFCHNQLIKVGNRAYGIQSHIELTREMFEMWMKKDADLIVQEQTKLHVDFNKIYTEYIKTGRQLIENFLHIAGF